MQIKLTNRGLAIGDWLLAIGKYNNRPFLHIHKSLMLDKLWTITYDYLRL